MTDVDRAVLEAICPPVDPQATADPVDNTGGRGAGPDRCHWDGGLVNPGSVCSIVALGPLGAAPLRRGRASAPMWRQTAGTSLTALYARVTCLMFTRSGLTAHPLQRP
jgi:hypothetical protein